MKKERFLSLRVKLTIGVVVICFVIGLISILSVQRIATDVIDKEYRDRAEQIAEAVVTTIDPEEAYEKLKARNLIVRKTELIAVAVNDAPGGLFSAAKVLGDAGINIEYGYAHKNKTEPLIFLRVDDPVAAVVAFKKAGMKTVTAKEL